MTSRRKLRKMSKMDMLAQIDAAIEEANNNLRFAEEFEKQNPITDLKERAKVRAQVSELEDARNHLVEGRKAVLALANPNRRQR